MSRPPSQRLRPWPRAKLLASLIAILPVGGCIAFGYGDVAPTDASDAGIADGNIGLDGGIPGVDADGKDGHLEDASAADASVDGAIVAIADTGTEVGPEAGGPDGAMDASTDASRDAAPKDATVDGAGFDSAIDGAVFDSSLDATTDSGDAQVCGDASCTPSCDPGWGDCDGLSANGCETDLTGTDNCGACGKVCSPNGGTAFCAAGMCDAHCDLSGTVALKLTLQATWLQSSSVAAGSGTFEYWLKGLTTHQGDEVAIELVECGRRAPPYSLWQTGETSLFIYPDSLFDTAILPVHPTTVALGDSTPDSSFDAPLVALQLGIDMADPVNDPWPNSASEIPAAMRVDMDDDGYDGITAHYSNESPYVYGRTSASVFNPSRSDRMGVGSRVTFSLSGALTSCTTAAGAASFEHLNLRLFSCQHPDDSDCTATEAQFVDDRLIQYLVGSASFELSKVADGTSCAAIRAALP